MKYYSQYEQDKYLYEKFFLGKEDGVFIEVGADDGVDKSNTYFFENLGWEGICIEPSPKRFEMLRSNRKCICENIAVSSKMDEVDFLDITGYGKGLSGIKSNYDPKHIERIERDTSSSKTISREQIKVLAIPLQDILDKHGLLNVDYCSIDVEGSELDVLKSIDFAKSKISIFSVEDNYSDEDVTRYLVSRGYIHWKRLSIDNVFVHKSFVPGWKILLKKLNLI